MIVDCHEGDPSGRGQGGTRLRPLTIHTPKPIVPIFNRPFLHYQIDLLKQVPEIDEVILSLNYQPRRIEEIFGDGSDLGIKIRYVVEPAPLGTAGAIKYAGDQLTESVVVFNGDVLTQIDLGAVIRLHRERKARATIVLTPVDNPTAYGLVDTDPDGNIRRFLEKPNPDEITTNNINAGIYILEPDTFDRIPERRAVVDRAQLLPVAHRAPRDVRRLHLQRLLDRHRHARRSTRRCTATSWTAATAAEPFRGHRGAAHLDCRRREIEEGATVEGPCFIDEGVLVKAGATVGPYSVIGRQTQIEEDAVVSGAVIWPNCRISRDACVRDAILGRNCHIGRNVSVNAGAVLGDKTTLTDFTKV